MSRRWAGLDRLRNDYRPRYCKSSLQDPFHQGIEQNIKDLVGDFLGDNNQTNITMVASPPMHSSTPMSTNSREAAQSKQQLVASASLDKLVKTPSKVAVSKSVQIIKTSCSPAVFRDKTVKKRVLGLEIGRTTTFLDEEDVCMVNDSPTLFIKEAGKRNVSEPEKVAKPTDILYAGDTSAVLEPSSPSVKLQARKRLSFKEKTFPMNKTLAVEVTKQNPPQDITKPMSPVEKTVLLNRTTVPSMVHTASKQNAENGGNVRNEETPIGLRKSHANEVEKLEKTQECTGVQPTLLDNEKQSKGCNLHLKETANQTFKSIFLGATQPEKRFSVFSQPPPPAPSLSSEKDSDDEFIIDDADTFTFKSWSRSFKNNKPSTKNQTAAAVAKTQLEKLSKTDVTQEYKVISSQTDINNENLYTATTVNIPQLSDRNKKVGVIKDQVRKNVSHADKTSKLCTPMAVESHQEQNNKTVLVKDQSRQTLSQTYATTDIQSTSVMKARVPRKRNTVFMDEDLATEVTTDNRAIAVKKKKSRKKKGGKQKWPKTVRNKTKCLSVVAVEKGLLKVQMNPDIASGNETRRSLAQTDTSNNKPTNTTLSKRDVAERIPSRTQDDITMTKENVKIPCGKMLKSNIVNTMPEIAKDQISSTDDATRPTSAGTKVRLVKSPLKKQDKIKEGKRKKKENISRKPKKKVGCQDNSNERDSASNVDLAENCMLSRSKNSWRQSAVHRRRSVVAANDVCSSQVVDPSVSEIVQCSPMEYRSKKRNFDDVMENNDVKTKPVKSILKTTIHKCELPISDKGPDTDLEVEEDENLQTDVFAVPQKLASRVSALRKSLLPTRQHQRLSSFKGSLESFGAAYAKSPLENKTQPHKLDLEVNDAHVSPIKVPGYTLKVAGPQTAILSVSSPHHVYSGSVNKVGGQIENMDFFTDDAEVLEEELEPTKPGKKDKYSTQKEYLRRLSSEGHTMKVNRPRKNIPPFSSQSDVSSGPENEDGSSTENMENISRKVEEGLEERHKPDTHGKVKFSTQKESLSSFPSVEDTLLNIASGAASSESCSKKHKLDDTFEIAGENIQPSALPYAHGSGSILKSGSGKITSRIIRITSERDDLIPFQLHESDSDCDSKYIDCNPNPQIHVTKKQKKIVLPSHTPNMRRSKRTRVQPLEYWRGERVDYRPRPSGGFVVDGVLSPNIDEKMYKKAKAKRKHPEQRETKDYKWVKDENGATVTEPTLVLDPVQGKEKYLECVKTEEECVFQSSDDLIGVCRSISQPTFSVGKLILGPLQEKGFQFVCQNTLIFYVVDGVVLTTVHCTSYRLKTGDYFFIPPNNMYNIKNLRENSSSDILFVQLKEIKQDLKTPDEE